MKLLDHANNGELKQRNAANLSNCSYKPHNYITNVIDAGVTLHGKKINGNATPET